MKKNIKVFLSSTRKGSNTTILTSHFIKGAEKQGACVELISLKDLEIGRCIGCGYCIKETNDMCFKKDDFQALHTKIAQADVVVLASPVYMWHFNGLMKDFLDRWVSIFNSSVDLKSKHIAVLLAHAAETIESSGGINAINSIKSLCGFTGMNYAGYASVQAAERNDAEKQLEALQAAESLGEKLATI